jgi:D-arabinose 1-dehydrogenase-like Zn-dependent alcohol dehydrogenase
MSQMTAVQISSSGAPFEVVKREIPSPRANQVRVKVQACGICHSDVIVKKGFWPGLQYPE